MATKRKPYKTYPEAFKLEALRLLEASDRPASEIARQLGIRRNQLYKWKEHIVIKVPTAQRGRPKKADQSDTATLRQENKRLREENEILKKAAAYFARESK
jgi:transposase